MATSLLNAGTAAIPSLNLHSVNSDSRNGMSLKCPGSQARCISSLCASGSQLRQISSLHAGKKSLSKNLMSQRAALLICKSALAAQCAEGQTQTIERQSTKITIAPIDNKAKSPELDDGGAGLPPRDDDGGGGGGGGGGWGGGFFFFGFLAFLGFFKDQENDKSSGNSRRR